MPELQQPDIVGNFLSSYATAQAQQQAQQDREFNKQRAMRQDQRAEQQFGMEMDANQLRLAVGRAEAFDNILRKVKPGDDASLNSAKSEFVNTFGGDPKAVAGVTMDRVMELRAESDLKLKELRARIAATERSNRPATGGGQGNAPSGYQWVRSADGNVSLAPITGGPADPTKKLTESQSKDLAYYQRGSAALAKLDGDRASAMSSGWNSTFGEAPFGIGNLLQTQSSRQGKQAAAEFLAAILRKDSGAALTKSDFDIYGTIFMPQMGDDPDTLAQKAASRTQALESLRAGLGSAQILAAVGAPVAAGDAPPPSPAANASAGDTPPPPPGFVVSK